jgi:hypothetical protein
MFRANHQAIRAAAACGVMLAGCMAAQAAPAGSNAAPAVCRSGSVPILVGGMSAETSTSSCNGFGREARTRASTGASYVSTGRRETTVATGSVDEERRTILENELQREMTLLKESDRDNTDASKQAAARSRANIEALRREIARQPGPVVR